MTKTASKPAPKSIVQANAEAIHREKAPKKVASKPLQASKPATKAAPKAAKGPKAMAEAALDAFADKLDRKFIGKAEIVSAKLTKDGCRLVLTDGKTVVLKITVE